MKIDFDSLVRCKFSCSLKWKRKKQFARLTKIFCGHNSYWIVYGEKEIVATTRIKNSLLLFQTIHKWFLFAFYFIALAICCWFEIKLWMILIFVRLLVWIVWLWLFLVRAELLLWLFFFYLFTVVCCDYFCGCYCCYVRVFNSPELWMCVWSLWRHGVCSRCVWACLTRWME